MPLELIIDVTNPERRGLLADFDSVGVGAVPDFVRNDAELPIVIRPVIPSDSANAPWEDDHESGDTYRVSIGNPDEAADEGTFTLTIDGETTAALAYDITAAALQTALSAASVAGGNPAVVVTELMTGTFQVDGATVGVLPLISGSGTDLMPVCGISVNRTAAGTVSTKGRQFIQIYREPVANDYPATAEAGGAGVSGTLSLNTENLLKEFARTEEEVLGFYLSVIRTRTSGEAKSILQVPVRLHRDIIDVGTLVQIDSSGPITSAPFTMATARLLGRTTASAGAIEEITVGTGLSLSAGSLTATSAGLDVGAAITATTDLTTFNVWRPVNLSTGTAEITLDTATATSGNIVALLATVTGGTLKVYNNTNVGTELFSYAYVADTATGRLDFIFNGTAWVAMSANEMFVPADVTAPTATLSPLDNATGVAISSNLVMTFSEAVTAQSAHYIMIKKTSDNSTIEAILVTGGLVTGSGTNTITINPTSDLANGIEYYVLVDVGAFEDAAGNEYAGISSATAWSFTTVSSSELGGIIADLEFDYRSDGLSAGALTTWTDSSTQGNNATQATSGKRPTVLASAAIGTNSFPAVQFDGVNDEFEFTSVALTDYTVFAVMKTSVPHECPIICNSAVNNQAFSISGAPDTTATATVEISGDFVDTVTVVTGGWYPDGTPTVTISGDGAGATCTAVLTNGVVTSFVVDAPGSGYTAATASFAAGSASVMTSYDAGADSAYSNTVVVSSYCILELVRSGGTTSFLRNGTAAGSTTAITDTITVDRLGQVLGIGWSSFTAARLVLYGAAKNSGDRTTIRNALATKYGL